MWQQEHEHCNKQNNSNEASKNTSNVAITNNSIEASQNNVNEPSRHDGTLTDKNLDSEDQVFHAPLQR